MAVMLYKAGDTHLIRGVTCEMVRCEIHQIKHYQQQGYVTRLEDIGAQSEPEPETPKTAADVIDKMSVAQIRAQAKSLGIKNWRRAPVEDLKEVIADV